MEGGGAYSGGGGYGGGSGSDDGALPPRQSLAARRDTAARIAGSSSSSDDAAAAGGLSASMLNASVDVDTCPTTLPPAIARVNDLVQVRSHSPPPRPQPPEQSCRSQQPLV